MLQVCRHGKGNDMKLEDLLGKELYAQVQAKLDEVNAKEPDKRFCSINRHNRYILNQPIFDHILPYV